MTESVQALERRRAGVLQQISKLGDFRPGCITTTQGKCGKPGCCCKEPDHPGHGPHWRVTYKVDGKTRTESLSDPSEIEKVREEIAEFRKFRQLSRKFVEVNTKICQSRAVESTGPEEKKRPKRSKQKLPGK